MEQHGILIVNKPVGMTSHDVVQKLRQVYRMQKVGHTGTLDPMTTGVMVIAFGKATKLVPFLMQETKIYRAEVHLGYQTDTEDMSGTILRQKAIDERKSALLKRRIPDVLAGFVGMYAQIPPMYAAIKVDGRKLYDYARQGQSVKRAARQLQIFSLTYDNGSYHYDQAKKISSFAFEVHGSKGLYVRTLCVDIGKKIGVPATMSALNRLRLGPYMLADAHDLAAVIAEPPALIPLKEIALPLPHIHVDPSISSKLRQGYKLPHHLISETFLKDEVFAVYDKMDGELIGLYRQSSKYPDKYQSVRVI